MMSTPVSRVAGEDRPLDRRRAAPARQQREVHVHETVRQRIEQRDRQQLPERDDHTQLRTTRTDVVDDFTRLLRRAAHAGRASSAAAFTGRRIRARAAAPAPVGLGDDERDLVAVVDQGA